MDTMRRGAIDLSLYAGAEKELLMGQIAMLGGERSLASGGGVTRAGRRRLGCALWLLVATYFNAPVSTSHSIVGATIGFSWTFRGFAGVRWSKVTNICECAPLEPCRSTPPRLVLSWLLSPVLSGLCAGLLYLIIEHVILQRVRHASRRRRVLTPRRQRGDCRKSRSPRASRSCRCSTSASSSSTCSPSSTRAPLVSARRARESSKQEDERLDLGFDQLSLTQALLITLAIALLTAAFVRLVGVKVLKTKIKSESAHGVT